MKISDAFLRYSTGKPETVKEIYRRASNDLSMAYGKEARKNDKNSRLYAEALDREIQELESDFENYNPDDESYLVPPVSVEDLNEFCDWLQGGEDPKGFHFQPEDRCALSKEQAFAIIYYLQEKLFLLSEKYEMCKKCGIIYDSEEEGSVLDESMRADTVVPEEWYGNYCDDCRPYLPAGEPVGIDDFTEEQKSELAKMYKEYYLSIGSVSHYEELKDKSEAEILEEIAMCNLMLDSSTEGQPITGYIVLDDDYIAVEF